jgi:hypothetical protein
MNTTSEARLGVDGEHHAGGAEVGAHHALHAGRQRHVGVREALVHAVADGAVVVERGEHLLHLVQHVLDADHVEEGLLLAGEGGVGQVFGRGRGAHREAGLRLPARASRSSRGSPAPGRRERLGLDPAADLGAGGGQRAHVFGVERGQAR